MLLASSGTAQIARALLWDWQEMLKPIAVGFFPYTTATHQPSLWICERALAVFLCRGRAVQCFPVDTIAREATRAAGGARWAWKAFGGALANTHFTKAVFLP